MEAYKQFKGQTRLPNFATPKNYKLYLKPDLSACTFSGTVRVNLTISQPTSLLVLNSLELNIHDVSFTNSANQEYHPHDVVLDAEDEILVLKFNEALGVGDGELRIDFSGKLNEHLRGFYRCSYMDGKMKKNMAATQFEAVDARRCFPCWDEPALKATFRITVDVPLELTALSNMPIVNEKINGNVKTVHFEDSPLMSTYLVALVVGVFDYIEDTTADGIKVCVYCPLGKSNKGRFALSIGVKALDLFAEYFSMPYPLPKLDMVAVPEFSGGAMENYGLITYRENELLYDELLSTAARKKRMATVVFHEVAHHWFGNLVTMEWWTHLWLNEGFATWISYMATDRLFPEWKIWTQFLQLTTDGLRMDALEGSHPIEVEIHHARSIGEIFDYVSYEKGSSVIRMLEGYLGVDIMKRSLGAYMKKYAWSNAKTEDLWSVLSEESGIQVNSLMDSWTKQKGYPVIFVKCEDNILEFEQSQFLSSGLDGSGKWIVPITLTMGSYDRCTSLLLESKVKKVNLSDLFPASEGNSSSFDEHMWIKVNTEQSGFYRVKYENKLEVKLREAIANNYLSVPDKLGILDDLHAFCETCKTSLSSLLSLMDVYRKEIDYAVLSKLIDVCYSVLEVATDALPDSVSQLKAFFSYLVIHSVEKLGWEPMPGESHLNALLRGKVYTALAVFGHDKTCNEARHRFQALLHGRDTPLLSADTKKAVYVAVIKNTSAANRDGLESLLKIYKRDESVQEKEQILRCLASGPDAEIVYEVLNFFVSDEVRDQDIIYGLPGISLEGRETAWRWLKEKWNFILEKYGAALLITHFVRDIISPLCSHEKADEVEEFFATRMDQSIVMNLRQSIELVRIKAKWVESIKQEHSLQDLIKQLATKE